MTLNTSKSRNVNEKIDSLIVRQVPCIVSMHPFIVDSLFNNVCSFTQIESTSSVAGLVLSLQLFQRYLFVFSYAPYSGHQIVGYCILNSILKLHFGHSSYCRNIYSFGIRIQHIIHYTGYFDSAFTVGFPSNR